MIKIDEDFYISSNKGSLTLQEAINEFKRIEEEIEQAFKENIKEGEEQG